MEVDKLHKEFFKLLERLDKGDWKLKVNENWTIKDVVAHLVGWEREDARTLYKLYKTRKRAWWSHTNNFDDFNKKSVKRYKTYSNSALIKEWKHQYKIVKREMKRIGITDLKADSKRFGWLFDGTDANHIFGHYKQIQKVLSNNSKYSSR
ncbi:MAG: maleylpyruvate isomerase N-terminal domain-containing protein [Candidatus Micrarchaeota archaeon]|nr:maleylpyruvate isomerase N-terminal domain-containing protein [Candidatus Micrarchaeota archaeon]